MLAHLIKSGNEQELDKHKGDKCTTRDIVAAVECRRADLLRVLLCSFVVDDDTVALATFLCCLEDVPWALLRILIAECCRRYDIDALETAKNLSSGQQRRKITTIMEKTKRAW